MSTSYWKRAFRSSATTLADACCIGRIAARCHVIVFQTDRVAAPELAVDRDLGPDWPNVLRAEWRLRTNDRPLLPRDALLDALCSAWDLGLDAFESTSASGVLEAYLGPIRWIRGRDPPQDGHRVAAGASVTMAAPGSVNRNRCWRSLGAQFVTIACDGYSLCGRQCVADTLLKIEVCFWAKRRG